MRPIGKVSRYPQLSSWLWGTGVLLGLILTIVVCVRLGGMYSNDSIQKEEPHIAEDDTSTAMSSSLPRSTPMVTMEETLRHLPRLNFLPGSVEEVCGLNDLPSYRASTGSLKRNIDSSNAFESETCRVALEAHMTAYNPHRFLSGSLHSVSLSDFVVLENPFTFERIFADPAGDFAKVQLALSREECLLNGDETNWELKDTCHADAHLNYALVNLFCFNGGVTNRIRPVHRLEDNPTLEQDRTLWKQDLEDQWVKEKCEELNPALELTPERYPELHALILSLHEPDWRKGSQELLVELAARLGDDAAGLTQSLFRSGTNWSFFGEGYKYGRYGSLVNTPGWTQFSVKKEPSAHRFLQTFHMLAKVGSRRSDVRDEIEFDWKFVARHLCEPPYFEPTYSKWVPLINVEHSSCKEVVHELRQQDIRFQPLLDVLDKFEQVALELDVYE